MYPNDLKYTKTHEWAKIEGNKAKVGLTQYAQEQLNDIVYVELPEVGAHFSKGESFAVVESVKSSTDVYMPISGKVLTVNNKVVDSPELINEDPYANWLAEIEIENIEDVNTLLDAEEYEKAIEEEEH